MDLLDDDISVEDINEFKKALIESSGKSSKELSKAEFDLAWALVRSQQKENVKEGIKMMESLIAKDTDVEARRAFMLYLAAAYFKIKDYDYALTVVNQFLQNEPNNRQAIELKQEMKRRIKNTVLIGAAVGGVLATTVGLGLMLLKRK